jgi:hypothetical protein
VPVVNARLIVTLCAARPDPPPLSRETHRTHRNSNAAAYFEVVRNGDELMVIQDTDPPSIH